MPKRPDAIHPRSIWPTARVGTTTARPCKHPTDLVARSPARPTQVAADIRAFGDIGVRHLILGMQDETLEKMLARLERFASVVRPKIDA